MVQVFNQQKCAAKVNLAFGFELKSFEDGRCWYFYPHETNTATEISNLVYNQGDVMNLKQK